MVWLDLLIPCNHWWLNHAALVYNLTVVVKWFSNYIGLSVVLTEHNLIASYIES